MKKMKQTHYHCMYMLIWAGGIDVLVKTADGVPSANIVDMLFNVSEPWYRLVSVRIA